MRRAGVVAAGRTLHTSVGKVLRGTKISSGWPVAKPHSTKLSPLSTSAPRRETLSLPTFISIPCLQALSSNHSILVHLPTDIVRYPVMEAVAVDEMYYTTGIRSCQTATRPLVIIPPLPFPYRDVGSVDGDKKAPAPSGSRAHPCISLSESALGARPSIATCESIPRPTTVRQRISREFRFSGGRDPAAGGRGWQCCRRVRPVHCRWSRRGRRSTHASGPGNPGTSP